MKGCAWGFLEKSLPGRTTARMQTWRRERAWLVSGEQGEASACMHVCVCVWGSKAP